MRASFIAGARCHCQRCQQSTRNETACLSNAFTSCTHLKRSVQRSFEFFMTFPHYYLWLEYIWWHHTVQTCPLDPFIDKIHVDKQRFHRHIGVDSCFYWTLKHSLYPSTRINKLVKSVIQSYIIYSKAFVNFFVRLARISWTEWLNAANHVRESC